MLTLDSDQLKRQRRTTEVLRTRHLSQFALEQYIKNKADTVADDGDLSVTNLLEQMGTPLFHAELERRIRLMNPNLIFEVSIRFPDRMGIYVEERRKEVLTLDPVVTKRMITSYTMALMPERSVRHYKKTRVPDPVIRGNWKTILEFKNETRGWRTVIYALLREGLIKLYQVEKLFPANDKSARWQKLISDRRQHG